MRDATSQDPAKRGLFPSRYNYFVRRPDGVLGYNALTGSFAHLAEDVAEQLGQPGPVGSVRDIASLIELGFLHEGSEFDTIRDRYFARKTHSKTLFLTIAPTIECNLSCSYCYQNSYRRSKVMSEPVQNAMLSFIDSLVRSGRSDVSCEWYGGEPLLALDLVLKLSVQIRASVERAGGKFSPMRIVTNGVKLDRRTASQLFQVGVTSAQISFDSLYYDGNKLRGPLNDDGTPSVILRNILESRDILRIGIRVNVGSESQKDVPAILKCLEDHGLAGRAYLARVDDFEKENSFQTSPQGTRTPADPKLIQIGAVGHGGALKRADFAKLEQDQFLDRPESLNFVLKKLNPKDHYCSATDNSMFVIDPDGYVSRCWHSAGSPAEAIGNVLEDCTEIHSTPVAKKWDEYSPFRYRACVECKVLPLCMGGCSYGRLFMDAQTPPCESIKRQIQFCVDTVGSHLALKK